MEGPVDINGLPRTGTTALANMLSLDPQFRSLRQWEQVRPCPPPTLDGEATDERRLQLARENDALPAELKAMHLYEVDASVEDTWLLGMAVHGQQYTRPGVRLPRVVAHRRRAAGVRLPPSRGEAARVTASAAPAGCSRRRTTTSTSRRSSPPTPTPRFVMTHRDPVKAVPSWASLVSTIFPETAGGLDLHRLGREVSNHLRVGVEQAIAARARIGDDRFHRRAPPGVRRRPHGCRARRLRVPRLRAHAVGRADHRRVDRGEPLRRAGHAPLHRGAVRSDRRAAPRRLPLLHRPLRRQRPRGHHDRRHLQGRPSHLGRPDARARARRRQPDRGVAARRRHRGRGPGHEQARAVDPGRGLPVPGLHRRAAAGVHAAVELRVQPGRSRPRLRVLDGRDRPAGRLRDLGVPRHVALRRDPAAGLRRHDAVAHAGPRRHVDATGVRPRRPLARRRRPVPRDPQRRTTRRPRR